MIRFYLLYHCAVFLSRCSSEMDDITRLPSPTEALLKTYTTDVLPLSKGNALHNNPNEQVGRSAKKPVLV